MENLCHLHSDHYSLLLQCDGVERSRGDCLSGSKLLELLILVTTLVGSL